MKQRTAHNPKGMAIKGSLCGAFALAALSVVGAGQNQAIRATVDGEQVVFSDVQPIMMNNRVMVPVRGVFEYMKATVEWDKRDQMVLAQHGSTSIRLPLNSMSASVNGRNVSMDAPAVLHNGRTMVPLRFLSESLGARTEWLASSRTVEIHTAHSTPTGEESLTMMRIDSGTVIPLTLNQDLSSNRSQVGQRFSANLDTDGSSSYQGLPSGSTVEGHVDVAREMTGETPGVLGLAFDRVRLPSGQTYPVYGSLIGLDANSVSNENGRLIAKPAAKNDNLKYVGYGAGGGAIVALLTKGNVLTNSLIGAALGYVFGELQKDKTSAKNVTQDAGTKFGMRLTRDVAFRVVTTVQR